MSNTFVQEDLSRTTAPANAVTPSPRPLKKSLIRRLLEGLASLELTVFLFVLSLLLVFLGTMAQIDNGIGTVMKQYFRSFLVWVPWQLLVQFGQVFFAVDRDLRIPGSFPFPAGWTLGTLLLANLLAAHLIRFKVSWKRSGILLIHSGLIVLMLGELFTGLYQVEARMTIATGETANYTDVADHFEVAFTTPLPEDRTKERVVVIPDHFLRQVGTRIKHDELPVDVEVLDFWKNSVLLEPGRPDPQGMKHPKQASNGLWYDIIPEAEASGVKADAAIDFPSVRIALYRKGSDEKLGEYFLSMWYNPNRLNRQLLFSPPTVTVDGTRYELELRPKREYKDYAITLKEFRHDKFPGTEKPRNFSSLVELTTDKGERREVLIYMNNPMWHRGETFYQSSFLPRDSGTVLQVVRNPSWALPYLSCLLVTLGMLVHFGLTLAAFLQRRIAS